MDKLNSIKLSLIIEQPFFGYLLMHIQFKHDDSIENIGTDGEKIYYNEEFIEEANEDEIKFSIIHQLLHIVLNHIVRSMDYGDTKNFSQAADLVVNSIAYQCLSHYQLGAVERINTDHIVEGKEASNWTVDQVYNMIKKHNADDADNKDPLDDFYIDVAGDLRKDGDGDKAGDDHSMWQNLKNKSVFEVGKMASKWALCLKEAMEYSSKKCGSVPGGMKRIIEYMERDRVDWKNVLRNFVETEVTDYSFNPPDKRYSFDNFLLPDFNETEDKVTGIFFFIDVSGSMNVDQIAECKAELRSCIKQYSGKVEGYLGYFDYTVSNIKRFDDEESMDDIEASGGGGTSFENIFKYLDENADMFDVENKKVIIMTDGYASFPDESSLNVDEVLWIINNDEVTPPFGEVVRI